MSDTTQKKTLAEVPNGKAAIIREFRGGNSVNRRLASLGFTPGVRVEMMQNYRIGPVIVYVRSSQVALGRGEARKIIVEEE